MQITHIPDGILDMELPKPTNEDMQNEYDYLLAEQLTGKLLKKGLITPEEYDRIMVKYRQSFSPFIAQIMS